MRSAFVARVVCYEEFTKKKNVFRSRNSSSSVRYDRANAHGAWGGLDGGDSYFQSRMAGRIG